MKAFNGKNLFILWPVWPFMSLKINFLFKSLTVFTICLFLINATAEDHIYDRLNCLNTIEKCDAFDKLSRAEKILYFQKEAEIKERNEKRFIWLNSILAEFGEMLKASQQEVKELEVKAYRDPLTGLKNRNGFEKDRRASEAAADPYYVVLFDIDFFKKVNDNYGHNVGDEVLSKIGEMLKEIEHLFSAQMRPSDYVKSITRWGGEEFLLLVRAESEQEVDNIVQRMQEKIKSHVFSKDFQITISIGISKHDNAEGDFNRTVERADNALYEAKENGRDKSVWSRVRKNCADRLQK